MPTMKAATNISAGLDSRSRKRTIQSVMASQRIEKASGMTRVRTKILHEDENRQNQTHKPQGSVLTVIQRPGRKERGIRNARQIMKVGGVARNVPKGFGPSKGRVERNVRR